MSGHELLSNVRMHCPRISRLTSALCSLLTVLALGCGSGGPPAKTADAPPSPGPVVAASVVPALVPGTRTRTPSDDVKALARPSAQDPFALYVDLEGLLRSDLARSLVPALVAMSGGQFPAWKECAARVVASGRELTVAGDGSGDGELVVTLRLAPGTAHETLAVCGGATEHPGPVAIPGMDEGVGSADRAIARRGDVLVVGVPGAIKTLVGSKPGPWPADLTLPGESFLVARGTNDGVSGHGQLTMNAARLLASAEVTLPDEASARQAEEGATFALKGGAGKDDLKGLDAPTRAIVAHLRESVQIAREGTKVRVALDLEESTADQAKDIGGLARFALYGVQQYLTQAKKVEAMVALRSIGVDYRSYLASSSGAKGARKRLHSFPAVPAQVPRGVRYQTSETDWKAWREIAFEYDTPQYFQYEIKAAKDGRSADIIARGDLDGDGKTSELKVHISLDPKTGELTVPTLPTETDGDE